MGREMHFTQCLGFSLSFGYLRNSDVHKAKSSSNTLRFKLAHITTMLIRRTYYYD